MLRLPAEGFLHPLVSRPSAMFQKWYRTKECVYRGQLHECLHHFVPLRAVHSFSCPDVSFLRVFASKVMHSLREITEAIHGCKAEHMLTSIALL